MINNATTEVAEIGVRLLDDAYLAWFSAESECERALHAWFHATGCSEAQAYFSYRAALDREEAAARDLARLAGLTEACSETLVPASEGGPC